MKIEDRELFQRTLEEAASSNQDDVANEMLYLVSKQPLLRGFVQRGFEIGDISAWNRDETVAFAQFKLATADALAAGWVAGRQYAASLQSRTAQKSADPALAEMQTLK